MSARGGKRRYEPTTAPSDTYAVLPDSMPLLDTESQCSVIVIDSQGVSFEPGPGVQRDQLVKAERAALITDARDNVSRAEAALRDADAYSNRARAQGERRPST